MEKLIFDTGIKEYEVNGAGVLRFNPADPNVYARFMDATNKINDIEKEMAKRAAEIDGESDETRGAAVLTIMRDADNEVKKALAVVFGEHNDFNKLFEGVNLMAVAGNGERVISNFFTAIEPIIVSGVKTCVSDEVEAAKAEREMRKEQ